MNLVLSCHKMIVFDNSPITARKNQFFTTNIKSSNRQKKNSQKEDASFKIVANQVELEKRRSKPNPKYSAVSKTKYFEIVGSNN